MSLPKLNYENTVASVLGSFIFSSLSLSLGPVIPGKVSLPRKGGGPGLHELAEK